MKLKTLLDYQKAFDLMRDAEGRPLTSPEFMACLRAKSLLDAELAEPIKDTELETT
jgi:hypothetical protein